MPLIAEYNIHILLFSNTISNHAKPTFNISLPYFESISDDTYSTVNQFSGSFLIREDCNSSSMTSEVQMKAKIACFK